MVGVTRIFCMMMLAMMVCVTIGLHMGAHEGVKKGKKPVHYQAPPPASKSSSGSSSPGFTINGKPYTFTGPLDVVCYMKGSTNVFRRDRCTDQQGCIYTITQYRQCLGKVEIWRV